MGLIRQGSRPDLDADYVKDLERAGLVSRHEVKPAPEPMTKAEQEAQKAQAEATAKADADAKAKAQEDAAEKQEKATK